MFPSQTPTALPDVLNEQGLASFNQHSWPFLTGFDILPHIADFLAERNLPAQLAVVCDRAGQRLFLPPLAESLLHKGINIVPPQQARLFVFLGGQNTMRTAHRFAATHPDTPYALIPTTLMAQVSGATGPDFVHGTWHPPLLSLCDVAPLSTMDKRHFRSNYAHIARLALGADESLFSWLEWWGSKAIAGVLSARLAIVRKCALLTQKVRDDANTRPALRLGEDFASAIMQAGHLKDSLFPGEALALGVRMAFGLSARLGYCPVEDAARMRKHLQNAGFQTSLRKSQAPHALHASEVLEEMRRAAKDMPLRETILARGIGKVFTTHDIESGDMAAVIDKVLSE